MKPTLVLYATRHGLARRVAQRLAERLREDGESPRLLDAAEVDPDTIDLVQYRAAFLVSSVQIGKLQPEMVRFAKLHHHALSRLPVLLFTVSMTAAGLARADLPPDQRRKKLALAQRVIDGFARETGWTPQKVERVAGALSYLEYGFFLRMVMRFISKQAGDPTDTSRNHEFTDWAALDRAAQEFLSAAPAVAA